MKSGTAEAVRLVLGGVVNVILLLMIPRLGVWSSDEREFHLAVVVSALAISCLVTVIPVIRKGKSWQQVAGCVLFILPCLSLWFPLEFFLKNR
jgi:hypothetical protein